MAPPAPPLGRPTLTGRGISSRVGDSDAPPTLSRRALAATLAAAGLTAGLPRELLASPWLAQADDEPRFLWPFDIDGDGVVGASDRSRVAAAIGTRRGGRLHPDERWDPAADVLAEGSVGRHALAQMDRLLGAAVPTRPELICWHYGWYGPRRRRDEPTTVRYLGGNYMSSDRRAEESFNRLKAEFGIGVDMLSWIDDPSIHRAWNDGYLSARNRAQRRLGLLYESPINLRSDGRIDMNPEHRYAPRLREDFRKMARWLRQATERGATLFRLDGRPVIYLFGSHTWGTTHRNLPHVGRTIAQARQDFADEFGAYPYLIGDEALFPGDEKPGLDRLYRAAYFDAVSRYHHYDEALVRRLGDGKAIELAGPYLRRIVELERQTMIGFGQVRNRFTDAPLLMIPSSAAGFAKRGLPSLRASGRQYRQLLEQMQALTDEHLQQRHAARLGSAWLPAPLAIVGSWNEEFEGHALMPAASNRALSAGRHGGFDWLYALRSIYGPLPAQA